MEPKSTAFYTAVAIGILAVLGATIFPTLGQAVQATTATQTSEEDDADQGAADEGSTDGGSDQEAATQRAADDDPQSQQDEDTGSTENNDGANDSPALASSDGMVSCGEEITTDVTLQEDLSCPGDGVTITADGVEFNMNGHTITSSDPDDSPVDLATDGNGNSGISVTGASDVDILGLGGIQGFDNGLEIVGSSDVTVSDVTMRGNGIGASVSSSSAVYLSKNPIDTNGYGVLLRNSNEGAVSFNQLISNDLGGVIVESSDVNVIAGNGVFGNGDNGIYLDEQSNTNTIDYNIVFGHEEADLNNADGMPTNINDNTFGENNKCGTSTPAGLC